MNTTIQEKLKKIFGEEDIKISFSNEQFDVKQTGVDFFSSKLPKKDFQFYLYEDAAGLKSFQVFGKDSKQSFAWLLGGCLAEGEFASKIPTHLICVAGARRSTERNEDGKFNGIIYSFQEDQIYEIDKEWDKWLD